MISSPRRTLNSASTSTTRAHQHCSWLCLDGQATRGKRQRRGAACGRSASCSASTPGVSRAGGTQSPVRPVRCAGRAGSWRWRGVCARRGGRMLPARRSTQAPGGALCEWGGGTACIVTGGLRCGPCEMPSPSAQTLPARCSGHLPPPPVSHSSTVTAEQRVGAWTCCLLPRAQRTRGHASRRQCSPPPAHQLGTPFTVAASCGLTDAAAGRMVRLEGVGQKGPTASTGAATEGTAAAREAPKPAAGTPLRQCCHAARRMTIMPRAAGRRRKTMEEKGQIPAISLWPFRSANNALDGARVGIQQQC